MKYANQVFLNTDIKSGNEQTNINFWNDINEWIYVMLAHFITRTNCALDILREWILEHGKYEDLV